MPKVSVVLTTFNRAQLLPRAVGSVLKQTTGDWELFICDDCSEDNTEAVAMKYIAADRRIRYLRQSERTGNVTKGRNDALDVATGDYVCFLDDDNAMPPEKLGRMSGYLEEHANLGMIYCRSRRMQMDGSLHDLLPMNKPLRFDASLLRQTNYIDSNEVMLRRSILGRAGLFDQRAIRFEDWEMWNRIGLVAPIEFLDEPLSWYCTHPQQRVLEPGNDQDNSDTRRLFNWKLAHGFPRWRTLIVWPDEQVTTSQQECMDAIEADLRDQDWIEPQFVTLGGRMLRREVDAFRPAAIVLFMLFRHPINSLEALSDYSGARIGVCVEDPFALQANMDRAAAVNIVVTNDASTLAAYEGVGQRNVIVMPTLAICDSWDRATAGIDPTHDVVVIGHAYPERVIRVRRLAMARPDMSFLAIGGEWGFASLPANVTVREAVPRKELVRQYQRGRIVLVLNRTCGSPGRLEPTTPARGFIEAITGRPTVHDGRRRQLGNWFDKITEVRVADDTDAMVAALDELLQDADKRAALARNAAQRAGEYTYRARWRRLIGQTMAGRKANIP